MADTGERVVYTTGAVREPQDGKGRFDLISPFALIRLARWYELGAKKYGYRNWEKGIPFSHCLDSAFRHLTKFLMGKDDEDHLAAVAWNVFAIMHYQELGRTDLDDLPHYLKTRSSPSSPPRVYLSGSIHGRVFREVWEERKRVAQVLMDHGFVPEDPLRTHLFLMGIREDDVWDEVVDDVFQEKFDLDDATIVRQDKELLEQCDAVLIITGDRVTSGTWLEFGYAKYRLGIPVVVVATKPSTWTRVEADAVVPSVEDAVSWLTRWWETKKLGNIV